MTNTNDIVERLREAAANSGGYTPHHLVAEAANLIEQRREKQALTERLADEKCRVFYERAIKAEQRITKLEAAIKDAVAYLYEGTYPEDPEDPLEVATQHLRNLETALEDTHD